ncbi:NAD(P)-dependent oxidoreductase [Geminocystis sp. CENA526]|uniref:NAD(P)-dependent oxidoreductase n=1 Tax=Geminocystis sp. CENA526 TaxID=1355871 RepID=UPI003D6FD130
MDYRLKNKIMKKVGILGMGLMGTPMTLKLVQANIPVIAYNRTPAKLEPLKQINVPVTSNIQDSIEFADVLILMLADFKAIQEVIGDKDLTGKTLIQMGTISPDESKKLLWQVENKGGEYLEAPVLGSIPEAKTGDLLVMVGATNQQFTQWQWLLKNYSPNPLLIGEVGKASALKLALNQMIAGLTATFALSLTYLQKQGVNTDTFMDILRHSALYAPTFDKKLTRMIDRNYDNPNFPTKHLEKDINLFLDSAQTLELNTIGLQGVGSIVREAVKKGFTDGDYSALIEGIEN